MKVRVPLLLISFLLFLSQNCLAETSIKAQVDKTAITTDDSLIYKLIVTSGEKSAPIPSMPKFEAFDVLSQAQSSTISFLKGKANTQLVYVFILAPQQAGKLKIGPGAIKIGGNTVNSEQFEIEVTQGKTKPRISPEQNPPGQKEALPESEAPQISL